MKKLVALCTTAIVFATGAMSVSAQEYEVEKGDSLWQIANDNNVTVDRLIDVNDLKTTVIHPKQSLTLTEKYIYKVKKGDTLSEIGHSEDVSVDDLMKWNDLTSDLIVIGQELSIDGSDKKAQTKESSSEQEQPADKQVNKQEKAPEKQAAKKTDKPEAKPVSKSTKSSDSSQDKVNGETIPVKATAYTAECDGCSGVTYTGVDLNNDRDAKVIAVDPNVIPLGSKVYVEGYGYAKAEDIGGAIKGNRIDLHVATEAEAINYGVQDINVTIVE